MAELVSVDPNCLSAAGLPAHKVRHLARMAERAVDGFLLFHPGHAFYREHAALFDGCRGEVPTEAAVAAVEAMRPAPRLTREGFPRFNGYNGSKRWAELHIETAPTPQTVERVISRVCPACQPRARALLAEIPPDFASLAAYRLWSWHYHAAVSADIGNPATTYEQAAARWGWESAPAL